ncbi:hypothetical protein CAC42_1090 [Sphaceloma murrayae]|uniref:Mediator of RNA polymerase II transcription subunit 14 n=1 Tax=Sphaceloma murrayae TaxID=2082308 RepID=A0A2K1R202_9PEZI|nr:hypothetical protein CAC42_1090 [Sphaceloma murrayae]
MPGRLVMDVKEPQGLGGLKRDGSHLSQSSEGREQKRVASDASRAQLNGGPAPPTNAARIPGTTTNGASQHDGGKATTKAEAGSRDELREAPPPELEHYRDTLVPFGKMVERMAQQTYFDLSEAIESLADVHIDPQAQLTNGVGTQIPQDKSRQSVDKKLRLLNFAQQHKDRFIKALVLSDWARNMDEMATLIDVSMFLRKQDWATHGAADGIQRLKENMIGAKMPNPNIEGALELLSTGQAPWMPDLGYVPPEPLTAQELLDTLSDMDFALSVRLNLHEQLPAHFQNYTIANGRATFIVAGEFEVDLAVADDDPESPFYFIDIRLLFTPASSFNNDRLRNQLEGRMNEVLAINGLEGCDEFLHNFVLTHKLNVIRCQALDLARGKWIDNIDVQAIHRSVVIHYWKGQAGGKNWIELGIASSKATTGAKRKPLPQISCRWFRRGQEVMDHDLAFNFDALSAEDMLDQVIAKHASGRLTNLATGLAALSQGSTVFSQDLETSTADAFDCSLRIVIRGSSAPLNIRIDPIQGVFCVQPQSPATKDIERVLNGEPSANGAAVVRYHFCRQQLGHIESRARTLGLVSVDNVTHRGAATSILRETVVFTTLQRPSWKAVPSATNNHALTLTYDLVRGPSWYLSQIDGSKSALCIEKLEPLQLQSTSPAGPGIKDLLLLERQALRKASESSLKREVGEPAKDCIAQSGASEEQRTFPLMYPPTRFLSGHSKAAARVYEDFGTIDLDVPRPDSDTEGTIWSYRTRLHANVPRKTVQLLHHSLKGKQSIWVGQKGEVQIIIRAGLTRPIKDKLEAKLCAITDLCDHVNVLAQQHFAIVDLRLDSVSFSYAPDLTCRVRLSSMAEGPLLDFGGRRSKSQARTNPHAAISKQLETVFVSSDPFTVMTSIPAAKLADFCQVLRATLPLLECARELESRDPGCSITFHCHNALEYRLVYRPPLPAITLTITHRTREGALSWWVKPSLSNTEDRIRSTLGALFKSKGQGWEGMRTAVLAGAEGLRVFLGQIDDVIRKMEGPPEQESGQVMPQQPPAQQQKTQGQNAAQNRNNQKPGNKQRGQEIVVLD